MMQTNCPCCSRTLTAYDQPLSLSNLTKQTLNTALKSKFDDYCASPDSENPRVKINENLEWDEDFHPDSHVASNRFTVKCACGAEFEMSKAIHLTNVIIPTQANKHWIDSYVKEELDITDYVAPAPYHWQGQQQPSSTGYYGASINTCIHNYVFQRNSFNGTVVKCSKCGHEKTM